MMYPPFFKKSLCLALFTLVAGCCCAQNSFTKYMNEAARDLDAQNYTLGIEKLSKALEHKEEAANNYKIADAYISRGYCRYKLNNYSSALTDIDAGLAIKPEYTKGYITKSLIYLADKKYEACIASCNKGLEKNAHADELLMNKSEALFFLKRYEEAKLILFGMLETDPRNLMATRALGSNFLHQKLWDSAVVYFSKVLEIDPLDHAAYYNRGLGKAHANDMAGAKEDIEKAIRLDSSDKFVGYNNLGFCLNLGKKDFAGAIVYFDKAIALKPGFSNAYCNKAFAELGLDNLKDAYRDVKKSIALDKTNSYAYKNLGLIYLKDSKKKDACENFKKAIELGYSEAYDDEVEKLLKENCN